MIPVMAACAFPLWESPQVREMDASIFPRIDGEGDSLWFLARAVALIHQDDAVYAREDLDRPNAPVAVRADLSVVAQESA
jgi:hypothetical protein